MTYEDVILYGFLAILVPLLAALVIFCIKRNSWSSKKRHIFAGITIVVIIGALYFYNQLTTSLVECEKLSGTVVIDIKKTAKIDAGRCHYRGVGEYKQWSEWQYYVESSVDGKQVRKIWIDAK